METWPRFSVDGRWPATREYLHLISQMLGKLRLALASPLPEWSHVSLALTPRGLTTGLLPIPTGALEAWLDVVDGVLVVSASGGRIERVNLVPARPVAEIWSAFNGVLEDLGVTVELWDKPQERADVTPFSNDERPRDYDPDLAAAWLALITDVHSMFETWRSPFFGRSEVDFWWGGFDMTVSLYTSRHTDPRPGSNYLMRHDNDAEHLSIGFWPGDEDHAPMFYGYVVPEPLDCAIYAFEAPSAAWAATLQEWVLPYEAVRDRSDPRDVVRRFMDATYRAAADLAGWDLASFKYLPPGPAPGRTLGSH
jgi:Family of unknown function (DUF5996)